jgi:small-conductance mechanosensitive channel
MILPMLSDAAPAGLAGPTLGPPELSATALLLIGLGFFILAAVLTPLSRRIPVLVHMPGTVFWMLAFMGMWAATAWALRLFDYVPGEDVALYFNAVPPALLILAAIRATDVIIVDVLLPSRRQVTVPRVLHEVCLLIVYFVAAVFFAKGYLNMDVSTVLAGSAVVSVVLGFGLQETLGNLFAGVTVQLSRPFTVGDWVRIGEMEGSVVEMNWRGTTIWTRDNTYIHFPNSTIGKTEIVNFSQPGLLEAARVQVGVDYNAPPDRVIAALVRAAGMVELVLPEPRPRARIDKFGDSAVEYELKFWFHDHREAPFLRGQVRRNIWYELRREGLGIPFPIRTVEWYDAAVRDKARAEAERAARAELLRSLKLLEPLSPDQIGELAARSRTVPFGRAQVICRQGDADAVFYAIARGTAAVTVRAEAKDGGPAPPPAEVARLTVGDFFGEMSLLTGDPRKATVTAADDVEVVAVGKPEMAAVLAQNKDVLERMSEIMAERQVGLARARAASEADVPAPKAVAVGLLERMKRFFGWLS